MNPPITPLLRVVATFLISAFLPSCGGGGPVGGNADPATVGGHGPEAGTKTHAKGFSPDPALPTPLESPWHEREEPAPDSPAE